MTLNFIGLLTLVVAVIISQLVGPKLVNLCDKLISYFIEISVFYNFLQRLSGGMRDKCKICIFFIIIFRDVFLDRV